MKMKMIAVLAMLAIPTPALALEGPRLTDRGVYEIYLTHADLADADGRARVLAATIKAAKRACFEIETRGARRACEAQAIQRAAANSPTVRQALAERTPVQVAAR